MATVITALRNLDIPGEWAINGEPTSEQEFNEMFRKIIGEDDSGSAILSSKVSDFGVTWSDVEAKIAELELEEPMAALREERNRKLAETDWMASSDVTMSEEWTTYRQALRDITEDISGLSLDNDGLVTGVTWPTKPE